MVLNLLSKAISNPNKPAAKATGLNPSTPFNDSLPFRRGNSVRMLDPASIKSGDAFSSQAMNFINSATSELGSGYNENQLLGAYMTSVYMFSALRRVANLISRVKVVAEIKEGDKFVRAPEDVRINQIFANEGAEILSKMWLNYAVYGATAVYKVKTRRAIQEEDIGRPIFDYKDGAVAGLFVIDKPMWELDEDASYGQINGLYVNQYNMANSVIGSRNYLKRREFVYTTDWNPVHPNHGKSIVAVAIHEAVANAAIAQWMSEYFTRGAMPFIMVTMDDDPAMMTDADLRKYKRQFEEYWQGVGSSLRSVFFDRNVKVEQVGIAAQDVAAPELNETALEGIAAAVGLDRELVVTPSGGSQERHEALIMRAWNDTIKPLAEKFLVAFNRDLGLPPNMRLVLDLSEITELEADRQDKADTEISIYSGGLQDYNETRKRLKMPPIDDFDGWYEYDGKMMPMSAIKQTGLIPHQSIIDFANALWDGNLAKRSEVLELLGRKLPEESRDGYKYDIEQGFDFVQGLWSDELLTRSQVLSYIGYTLPPQAADGYKSEVERRSDFGKTITELWSDNLLTRSQTIKLLDMDIEVDEGAPDGYADEIGDRKQNILDLWGDNLIPRFDAMKRLGVKPTEGMPNGFKGEIEALIDRQSNADQTNIDNTMDFWDKNLITRSLAIDLLKLPKPNVMMDGFTDEIQNAADDEENKRNQLLELWDKNLLPRSDVLSEMGKTLPPEAIDDYQQAVDIIAEALATKKASELTAPPPNEDGTIPPSGGGSPFGGGGRGFHSIASDEETDKLDSSVEDAFNNDRFDADRLQGEPLSESTSPINVMENTADNSMNTSVQSTIETENDIDTSDIWKEIAGNRTSDELTAIQSDLLEELDDATDWNIETIDDPDLDSDSDNPELDIENIENVEDLEPIEDILSEDKQVNAENDIINKIVTSLIGVEEIPEDMNSHDMLIEAVADAMMQPAANNYTYLASERHNEPTLMDDIQSSLESIYLQNIGADEALLWEEPDIEETTPQLEPLYVSLSLSNNQSIKDIQDHMAQEIQDNLSQEPDGTVSIGLQNPDTYHITLAYFPNVTEDVANKAFALLPKQIDTLTLQISDVTTWQNKDNQTVIKIDVTQNTDLIDLQQKVMMAFAPFGIETSPYSAIDEFKPHITLAYAPANLQVPEYHFDGVIVRPSSLVFSRNGYVNVNEVSLEDHSDWWNNEIEPYTDYDKFKKYIMPRERYEEKAQFDKMIRSMWIKKVEKWIGGDTQEILPPTILKAVSDYGANEESLKASIEAIKDGRFDSSEGDVWLNGENPLKSYMKSSSIKSNSKTVKHTKITKEKLDQWATKANSIKDKFNIPLDEDDLDENQVIDNDDSD